MLLFFEFVGIDKHKHTLWKGLCDCGAEKITATPRKTQSCGCLQRKKAADSARGRAIYTPEERKERARKNAALQGAKRKSDPKRAMHSRISRLHRHALSRIGALKTSPTLEQLGYTVEDFVSHIEKQFVGGMSWKNMSLWQIDHIIPISTAKTIEDVITLNQLSNLRPLWAKENNAKKNKLVWS